VDEVVVLAEGRVVQRGSYAELVAVEGPLRAMAEREAAGELLARA
jgi:ATP-binding cassette subfamily C protein CydCD